QVDIEASFMNQEETKILIENMMKKIMLEIKGIVIASAFPVITYEAAMNRYVFDKPDTRFEMELNDLSTHVAKSSFKVFANAVANGGQVKSLVVKGAAEKYSRKDIDGLGEFAARYGAKGLAWVKVDADGF